MWQDKYIGIPFKANGRDENGLDCWGLVRLIYNQEYNIQLPSFSSEYVIQDDSRINDLIAQYKEGWEQVEKPVPGSVVLFKILGGLTHIAVMVDEVTFIHVRPGSNTVIDTITNTKWKNRITGFFKYNENTSVVLTAVPHPLSTKRITVLIDEGITLEELYEKINTENAVNEELSKTVTIMLNGVPIPRVSWNSIKLKPTDVVEYRAVPGKDAIRMVALIAIAYYAPYLVEYLAGATGTTSTFIQAASTATAGPTLTFAGTVAAAATVIAGSYLINAIAPIRPDSSEDPGNPDPQNLLTGNSNPYNPYGAIPVVLGRIRYNPPLGAKSFANFTSERESFLTMLLVWGYGPLTISGYRVGDTSWDDFQFNSLLPYNGRMTLDRKTTLTAEEIADFDKIYGMDVDQQYSGLEMIGVEVVTGGGFVGPTQDITLINGNTITIDTNTGDRVDDTVVPDIVPTPYDDEGNLNFGWHINEDGDGTPYYNGEALPDLPGSGNDGGDEGAPIEQIGTPGPDIVDDLQGEDKVTTPVTGGGGPGCPDPDTPISLSYTDSIRAGDLQPGDYIFTVHEHTGDYGIFPVVSAEIIEEPKVRITFKSGKTTVVSNSHKYLLSDNTWNTVSNLAVDSEIKGYKLNEIIQSIEDIGLGPVIRFEIRDAHTYIASGLISHNKQKTDDDATEDAGNGTWFDEETSLEQPG